MIQKEEIIAAACQFGDKQINATLIEKEALSLAYSHGVNWAIERMQPQYDALKDQFENIKWAHDQRQNDGAVAAIEITRLRKALTEMVTAFGGREHFKFDYDAMIMARNALNK